MQTKASQQDKNFNLPAINSLIQKDNSPLDTIERECKKRSASFGNDDSINTEHRSYKRKNEENQNKDWRWKID